jgi:aldehyde dehydrogenase (NAD+)
VLFYWAENLQAQGGRFVDALAPLVGRTGGQAEVQAAVESLFAAAAWADKHEGAVHQPPMHGVTLALHEPIGTLAIIARDERPLAGLIELVAPAVAMGNRVVAVPSRLQPLVAAELYQVLDTSDLPGGVVNLVTGDADTLADVLAAHADVDALWWPAATPAQASRTETLSVSNLKRMWTGEPVFDIRRCLEQAVQVKNVWVPYGV